MSGNVSPGTAPAFDVAASIDGQTNINRTDAVAVPFDKSILAGSTGSFTLRNVTGASDFEVFSIPGDLGTGAGQIEISGQIAFLRPTSAMPASTDMSVRWTAGAVTNLGGIAVAANATDTLLNFTTAAASSAIEFIGRIQVPSTSTAGTTTQSLAALGLQQNDVVLVFQQINSPSAVTCGVSDAGWTTIASINSPDSIDTNVAILWKAMGSTPDTSVTFNSNGSSQRANQMEVRAYRGVNTTTPILNGPTNTAPVNGNVANPSSLTTTQNGALIVVFGGGSILSGETVAYASSDLTDFFAQRLSGVTNSGSFGIGHKAMPTAGVFDPAAFTGPATDATLSTITSIFSLNPA
ncbi:MAG: hypothetical protein ACRCSU_07855 [Paracoccaceae bacterium]